MNYLRLTKVQSLAASPLYAARFLEMLKRTILLGTTTFISLLLIQPARGATFQFQYIFHDSSSIDGTFIGEQQVDDPLTPLDESRVITNISDFVASWNGEQGQGVGAFSNLSFIPSTDRSTDVIFADGDLVEGQRDFFDDNYVGFWADQDGGVAANAATDPEGYPSVAFVKGGSAALALVSSSIPIGIADGNRILDEDFGPLYDKSRWSLSCIAECNDSHSPPDEASVPEPTLLLAILCTSAIGAMKLKRT